MSGKVTIGITGTGSLIGQAIIKSIQRSDLREKLNLVGFDYFPATVGSFWCSSNYILPDILKSSVAEEEWLQFIILKIKENDIRLLFIGVDFELPLFARHKQKIEAATGTVILVSSEEVIAIADDKYKTYQFLKENDLYYPQTFLPCETDMQALMYPVIIKPRKGARSVGVNKVNNAAEALQAMSQVKEPVIQECVGTMNDEFTCGTIFLNDGLKKMIILNRSLKEGNTFISHYKADYPEAISKYLKDVCTILKPFGACNFQLRLSKDGIPKIFEINSRHSGTTYIRSLFGYKEIEYLITIFLFNTEIDFTLREGTVVRYYDEFFTSN